MVEPNEQGSDEEQAEQNFIEKPAILDQLKAASLITNSALAKAKELCQPGADIYNTCQAVDAFIEEELRKVYSSKKTKKLERGIAFPCCLSVNHVMGHFSPLKEDSE